MYIAYTECGAPETENDPLLKIFHNYESDVKVSFVVERTSAKAFFVKNLRPHWCQRVFPPALEGREPAAQLSPRESLRLSSPILPSSA